MRNKILMITALLVVMVGITGTAFAATESMSTSFNDPYIETNVWDLKIEGGGHWYVLRYYPPNSLTCNSGGNVPDDTNCFDELNVATAPSGYTAGTPHFSDSLSTNNYQEQFLPNEIGWWVVSLWHSGIGTGEVEILIQSYKICKPVDVPIPEFSSIAIPIAAVLGLVFFFQHRKRKEE